MENYKYKGWCTRANVKCADGRTIMKDAFKHNDGETVPLVWNHQHNDPLNVLGHALLENRDEGVYAYIAFNDTESGQAAEKLVQHGDVKALSIYANQLKQQQGNVIHGCIREVSLVLAGANPGAYIDSIISHGEDSDEEGTIMFVDEDTTLVHNDEVTEAEPVATEENALTHADENNEETDGEVKHAAEEEKKPENKEEDDETLQDIFDTFNEKQKTAVYIMLGQALQNEKSEKSEGEKKEMKQNVFENDTKENTLTHANQQDILSLAKQSGVGSLQAAINMYAQENSLAHGVFTEEDMVDHLFPEFKNLNPGAPDIIRPDQSWVMGVINKIHKSPYSRLRTRQADARAAELRAKGYKKGEEKTLSGQLKMLKRETTPQTVYRKDELHRDDIVDITDFDVVAYQWGVMKDNMYEELALAALVGDGRDALDPDKISEDHIRSIWHDEELYTIHRDVDIEAARAKLQGTDTNAHFGENYIYAEAMIEAALYSREKFKGTGTPDLYCAPHLVNIMLLARDLNGRRIYESKADLAKALNVGAIHEIEQLEGKVRTDSEGNQKKLLGLFVNLADYTFGSTKGGELTKFSDFDIDFNKYKYLMETRLCGALTKVFSAIALEEPVVEG